MVSYHTINELTDTFFTSSQSQSLHPARSLLPAQPSKSTSEQSICSTSMSLHLSYNQHNRKRGATEQVWQRSVTGWTKGAVKVMALVKVEERMWKLQWNNSDPASKRQRKNIPPTTQTMFDSATWLDPTPPPTFVHNMLRIASR